MSEHDDYDDEPETSLNRARTLIYWPSILIWFVAFLQFLASLFGIAWFTSALLWGWFKPEAPFGNGAWPALVIGILVFVGCTILNLAIMRGAIKLRSFQDHRFVARIVILFALSLPFVFGVIVSVPIALCSLLILRNYDVRARFGAVAKEKALPKFANLIDSLDLSKAKR